MFFIIILFIIQGVMDFILIKWFLSLTKSLAEYTTSLTGIVDQLKKKVGR